MTRSLAQAEEHLAAARRALEAGRSEVGPEGGETVAYLAAQVQAVRAELEHVRRTAGGVPGGS